MKWAGLPGVMAKSVVLPLKTTPVGVPIADCAVWGIVTVNGTLVPAPLSSVETPERLSATHHGLVVPLATPQGFFRFGSGGLVPSSAVSETKFVCWCFCHQ